MTRSMPRKLSTVLFGGCLAFGISATAGAQQAELRIGFLAPTTGPFAQIGKDMVDGFQMYLDEVKNDFGGAKVTFIVEDEQGKPDTAVTKARKLVLQDKVQNIRRRPAGLDGATRWRRAPRIRFTFPVAAADDLTQRDLPNFYFIRTGWTSSQPSIRSGNGPATRLQEDHHVGADYAFGYEVVGGFHKSFEACGGQIIQKIWPRSAPRTSDPTCRP